MNIAQKIVLSLMASGSLAYLFLLRTMPQFKILQLDPVRKTFKFKFGLKTKQGTYGEHSTIQNIVSNGYQLQIISDTERTFFFLYKDGHFLKELDRINWRLLRPEYKNALFT